MTRNPFVNLEMISQGQAILYTVPPNIAHVEKLRLARDEARQKGYGVWNPAQPLDMMPDCYRKLKIRMGVLDRIATGSAVTDIQYHR